MFKDFWDTPFRVKRNGNVLTPSDWPEILKYAGSKNGKLRLEFELG